MGYPTYRAALHRYFMDHPGRHIWLDELIEVAQKVIGKEPTRGSIQHAITRMMETNPDIQVVERANCWIYRPNSSQVKEITKESVEKVEQKPSTVKVRRLFELVHTTKQGAMILEDEDGVTIVVKEVDI